MLSRCSLCNFYEWKSLSEARLDQSGVPYDVLLSRKLDIQIGGISEILHLRKILRLDLHENLRAFLLEYLAPDEECCHKTSGRRRTVVVTHTMAATGWLEPKRNTAVSKEQ